jgi:hypothetical protein
MSIVSLSPRDRRALAIGALAIAGIVGLGRGLPAWRQWLRETRTSAAELTAELARAERSVSLIRATRDTLVARNRRFLDLGPALIAGETPAAAGATLATLVSGIASSVGVRTAAVQVRPDTVGKEIFTRVAVRADLVGDVQGLTALIAALERGPALLSVRDLSITQPEPAAPADRAEVLRAQILVEGLALGRGRLR